MPNPYWKEITVKDWLSFALKALWAVFWLVGIPTVGYFFFSGG